MENCGSSIDAVKYTGLNFLRITVFMAEMFGHFSTQNMIVKGAFNVNKNDLISAVADNSGLSKADAGKAVDGVFDAITSTLQGGGDVRVVGFGTFSTAQRKATTGRNPRTGEAIQIPASTQPKFKAGKGLKDAVNG